ncbi:MAG: DNA repair protein RecO, partial [Eubacterium sp.]|nr:DNA repair protein RecO [Eubacterium sp.]
MSNILKVKGIVLSVFPLGENDKNLTILTRERGKIQVVSRGCRRTNHPLFAASNEYIYGEFVIAEGRTMKYLNSAEIHMSFSNLRDSFERICYSSYFCELASWFTMEGQDERDILNLLYLTFLALGKNLLPYPLIRRIFELKILQCHGIGLQSLFC